MAPPPFWEGYLKLSLVTCPVSMMPATTESERFHFHFHFHFHTLNSETGNRVQSRYVDAVTGAAVDEDDEVKGYPRDDHEYVMLPGGRVGEEAFAVIREAMRATKTAGIARLVLYRREGAVLLETLGYRAIFAY
jgi:DNA end-binding protein Ku